MPSTFFTFLRCAYAATSATPSNYCEFNPLQTLIRGLPPTIVPITEPLIAREFQPNEHRPQSVGALLPLYSGIWPVTGGYWDRVVLTVGERDELLRGISMRRRTGFARTPYFFKQNTELSP